MKGGEGKNSTKDKRKDTKKSDMHQIYKCINIQMYYSLP